MIADRAARTAPALTPGRLARQRDRAAPNNLPLPLSSFVGRAEALAAVRHLLAAARLLTLTGPGGVGKTRLALELALGVLGDYDGVWWVDLAPLCEAGLVARAVALGLPDDPARPKVASLRDHLRDGKVLLVLDNCEHVIEECAQLAGELLHGCARLHLLCTSREPLAIDGEAVTSVPPLSLPCDVETLTLDGLAQSEAGQLFLERARAVQPELALTEAAARAIGQICCHLDGLPLAIELAAVRLRVLSVAQIAERLADRFRLLTGGSRAALPRHQTLQATIDWSCDLLTRPEQKLFERLVVFVGGSSLPAAEAVASGPAVDGTVLPADLLDLHTGLVLKSLLSMRDDGQVRYRMLETIRQYAWQRLEASAELNQIRQRHLAYYLELASRAESKLMGAEQARWLKVLEVEHDNLRAALSWSLQGESRELGLRLATALAAFWLRVGYLSEGSSWLERALACCVEVSPVRSQALYRAGRLAQQSGDYRQALAFAEQSLALGRELDDRRGIARALGLEGWIAHWQGDRERAGPLLEEALALARDGGDERTIARTLLLLGDLRLRQGMPEQATALLEESLALYQEMGDAWSLAWAQGALGDAARLRGDYKQAAARLKLGLALYQELDSRSELPFLLEALALTAADQGHLRQAACLWGGASGVRDGVRAPLPPSYQADYAPYLERVRSGLGQEVFAAAWAEGRAMTTEQVLSLAYGEAPQAEAAAAAAPPAAGEPSAPVHKLRPHQYGLTPREVDVLRLVAAGLSDAQVAERLVLSPRTVGKHLQSIYSKLDLPSRSAATRWAIEHHLG